MPEELDEKPAKPRAGEEPQAPFPKLSGQEDPPSATVGRRGPDVCPTGPGHCQLTLKEHQDFPKEAGMFSKIRSYPKEETKGSFHPYP